MKIRILAIYIKEEEMKDILNKIKKYSFDDLSKHSHFEFSVLEKATDENLLR